MRKRNLFLLAFILQLTAGGKINAGNPTSTHSNSSAVTGIWHGTYSWNCTGGGSSDLTMELTQIDRLISGTASYLDDRTSLYGSIEDSVITLTLTGTDHNNNNYFVGIANDSVIKGTTLNGERCSADSGQRGSFVIARTRINNMSPQKLRLVGPSSGFNTELNAYTVELLSSDGQPSPAREDVQIALQHTASGAFYVYGSDAAVTSTSVFIPAGAYGWSFFYKASAPGTAVITTRDLAAQLPSDTLSLRISGGTIRFKLNGVLVDHSRKAEARKNPKFLNLTVAGYDSSSNYFYFSFYGDTTGTFSAYCEYDDNNQARWTGSETVVVTSYGTIGNLVEGTFSGTCTPFYGGASGTKKVTDGSFSVYRQPDQQ